MGGVLEGLSILVAEDNEPSLELALALLRLAGATATGVSNGDTAVDLMAAQGFDIVLMDVQMPAMDGCTATRLIRDSETDSHVLILGVTAHAMPEHHDSCLEAGMDAVITKPIDPSTFTQQIREYWEALSAPGTR